MADIESFDEMLGGIAVTRGDIAQACSSFHSALTADKKQVLLTVITGGYLANGRYQRGLVASGYVVDSNSPDEMRRFTEHLMSNWALPGEEQSPSTTAEFKSAGEGSKPVLDADHLRLVDALEHIITNRSMLPLTTDTILQISADTMIHPDEMAKLIASYQRDIQLTRSRELRNGDKPGGTENT